MDALGNAVIPILVALLTIGGGVFGYGRQKAADRKSALSQSQQDHYRAYLFAIQRVLTSCIRTDRSARREAIDEFRSFEAYLYVAAPKPVAAQLAELHRAFFDYTRCVRCKYEQHHLEKHGETHPPERLAEFEDAFLREYETMVMRMRQETLGEEAGEVPVKLSLASREAPASNWTTTSPRPSA